MRREIVISMEKLKMAETEFVKCINCGEPCLAIKGELTNKKVPMFCSIGCANDYYTKLIDGDLDDEEQ